MGAIVKVLLGTVLAGVVVSLTGLLTSLVVGTLVLLLKVGAVLAIGWVAVKLFRRLERGGSSLTTRGSGDSWLDTRN